MGSINDLAEQKTLSSIDQSLVLGGRRSQLLWALQLWLEFSEECSSFIEGLIEGQSHGCIGG